MVFTLRLFGGVSLEGDGGPLTGPAVQRLRLGLLALLAATRPRTPTRDKLMALLWPERDTERARGLLNQAVHVLRRALGPDAVRSTGEELQLDLGLVSCDVTAFEEAVSAGELERAAGLYAGPFLDGFFLSEAPEFERWADRERERLAAAYAGVLESLAEKAGAQKDWRRAAEWWKRRVAHDPYDSRAVARLMLALEASGNRGAAILQAEAHQRVLREDLGLEPSPEVRALAERLRSSPAASGPWLPAESAAVSAGFSAAPAAGDSPAGSSASPAARPIQATRKPHPLLRYGLIGAGSLGVLLAAAWLGWSRTAARSQVTTTPMADEIARAVANELARREQGDTLVRLPQHRTRSIPAYELYLRGSDQTLLRSDSAALRGLDYLRRAVALDSTYAAAWAGLARMTLNTRRKTDPVSLASAEVAAKTAVGLNDSLAEAHATLAMVRLHQYDLAAADSHFRRATVLEPGTAIYHEWFGKFSLWLGRSPQALAEAQHAIELSPMSPTATAELGRALLANGRCDEALVQLEKVAGLEPPLLRVPGIMAQCYAQKGMLPEAIAAIRPQAEQGVASALGLLGYLLARAGQREEASRVIVTLREVEGTEGEASWPIALVYIGLQDIEQAISFLNRAVDSRSLLAVTEPMPLSGRLLDSLRGDPRIARLRQRMGLRNP